MQLSKEERETHFYISDADSHWTIWTESTIFRRQLIKKGYKPTVKGEFIIPINKITVRSNMPRKSLTKYILSKKLEALQKARVARKKIELRK